LRSDVSPELIVLINVPSVDNPDGSNVTVREISPIGHSDATGNKAGGRKVVRAGKREVVVGKSIASDFRGQNGAKTRVRPRGLGGGRRDGRGKSSANSEIFADLNLTGADS